jgi:molybdopterin molybdotransferase
LAAVGKNSIQVKKKLRIGYFTSGNELLSPSENLSGSKINNSNQYALHSLLNKNYLDANYLGVLVDSKKKIINLLFEHAKHYSVIITTGGASVGEEDHLIDLIKENGELLFWKTAIKPGRPLAVGKIDNTIIICFPGNPVSVYLLYGMLIKSFLEKLCGSEMVMPTHYSATVNFSMSKKTERLEWLRVNIDKKCNDKIFVNKYPKQGSGMISSIAYADGIIEIPEEISQINKGDKFRLYLFSDLFD